jgi:hypothetical protein
MRTGGGYALAIVISALAWGFAFLLATQAFGYDDADYCRDIGVAEQQYCRALYLSDLGDCAWTRATEKYLGIPEANRNAIECRNNAREDRNECMLLVGDCS